MPDFLRGDLQAAAEPLVVLGRLVVAMLLGGVVAWIYQAHPAGERHASSLAITLVLLVDPHRDGDAGDRRQRGASVQPGRRAVHRPVQDGRARHRRHGVRHLCRRRRDGGRREPLVGRAQWDRGRRPGGVVHDAGRQGGRRRCHVPAASAGRPRPRCRELARSSLGASRQRQAAGCRWRPPSRAWQSRRTYAIELRSQQAAGELVKALNRIEGVQSVALNRETLKDESKRRKRPRGWIR